MTGEINGSYLFWNPQWGLRDVASQLNEGHPCVRDNLQSRRGGGALEVTKQLSGKDRENLGKKGRGEKKTYMNILYLDLWGHNSTESLQIDRTIWPA